MEKNVAHFSLYVNHETVEKVYYIESVDKKIIKSELLDDRFKRVFHFLFDDRHCYEEVIYFLKSRTQRDAKKGNLQEIYDSIIKSDGKSFNDTLSIEFTSFYLPDEDD